MNHTDRIPTRTDHVLAFAAGAAVCLCMTIAGSIAILSYATKRGLI